MEDDKTIYSPAVIGVYVLILSITPITTDQWEKAGYAELR